MPWENGVHWRPLEPEKRGRFATFDKAVDFVAADLLRERNAFFDSLADRWPSLFPDLPIRPGRYENGKIYLYVGNAPTLFMMRSKLPLVRRRLQELPGAPKRLVLLLEIRAS